MGRLDYLNGYMLSKVVAPTFLPDDVDPFVDLSLGVVYSFIIISRHFGIVICSRAGVFAK